MGIDIAAVMDALRMMGLYKLFSRDFLADMDKVPRMLKKRKLSFLPHFHNRSAKEVRQAFKRAAEEEKNR